MGRRGRRRAARSPGRCAAAGGSPIAHWLGAPWEAAQALTDLIDTARPLRLEVAIVVLILFEILLTAYQMFGVHALTS